MNMGDCPSGPHPPSMTHEPPQAGVRTVTPVSGHRRRFGRECCGQSSLACDRDTKSPLKIKFHEHFSNSIGDY